MREQCLYEIEAQEQVMKMTEGYQSETRIEDYVTSVANENSRKLLM